MRETLARMEQMLAALTGGNRPARRVEVPVVPDVSELSTRQKLQAEGQFILQTQGLAAYKRFWTSQARKPAGRRRVV